MHPSDGPVVDDRALRDPDRLRALDAPGLLGTPDDARLDRWARVALEATGATAALLSLVDDERAFFKVFQLAGGGTGTDREVPIAASLCRELVVRGEPFIVEDTSRDPRASSYEAVRAFPIGAYAGLPVRSPDGHVLGAMCVVDTAPRPFTEPQLAALATAATAIETELELQGARRLHDDLRGMRHAHQQFHERMLEGAPLRDVLRVLEAGLERRRPGARAAIVLDGVPVEPVFTGATWRVPVLRPGGGALGVLRLDVPAPRRPTAACVELLQEVARLATVAVERTTIERRLVDLASTDPLTGLRNRATLLAGLEARLAAGQEVTVLFCDLDGFKAINDSAGHEAGDAVLARVAERLGAVAGPDDLVGRMGGDEFVLVSSRPDDAPAAQALAARIRDAIAQPVTGPGGAPLRPGASVGLVRVAGTTAQEAIRRADAAMYAVKRRAGAADLVLALAGAEERGELRLVFQPVVGLGDGAVHGFEALLRWRHPELGDVPPDRFVPAAEHHGAIGPIERWVVRTAVDRAAAWNRDAGRPLPVAVNLSASRLHEPSTAEDVLGALAASGLSPHLLRVEVTETALVGDPEAARATLARLRAAGVAIRLDDFGTGCSSLSHLRTLPVDAVKVDRSFVAGLAERATDRALVAGLVALADGLGVGVVAEGVEDEAQAALLRQAGCELAQGWLFAVPQEAEAVDAWVASGARAWAPEPVAA